MNILGINVYHADTSACLIKNGNLIAASEEERFTRIKHYSGFPVNSIKFCLKKANISFKEIDYITVNFNLNYNFYERFKFAFSNITSSNLLNKLLSACASGSPNRTLNSMTCGPVSVHIKPQYKKPQ